jgi:hypothetical protein
MIAAVLAAALGAAAVTSIPLHSAPAPEAKPQRWEYKVVLLHLPRSGDAAPQEQLAEQLNSFAKDGWEYAGPVLSDSTAPGRGRQYVAFRRSKS